MSKAKIISELLALVEEFLSIEQEYQFAQARADAHRDKAIEGDVCDVRRENLQGGDLRF